MIFVRRRSAGVLIGLPEVNICRVSTTKKVREGMGPAPGEASLHPDVLLCACVKMHRFRARLYIKPRNEAIMTIIRNNVSSFVLSLSLTSLN